VKGDEVVVLTSGLGAQPVMELYLLFDEVRKILDKEGISIYKAYTGNYFTSMEMLGASVTIMKLDDELKQLIDMPVYSVGMKER